MKERWDEMSNEELCLEYQETRNNELFNYMLNKNKRLAWFFARKIFRKHPDRADSINSCCETAIWETMLVFDKTRDSKFSTTLYWYVLKNMRDFWEEIPDIRLPVHVREKLAEFKELHKEDNFVFDTISIHTPLGNKYDVEDTIEDTVASEENIEADMEAKADREELIAYARRLDARTCACIIDYFGLEDNIPKTLQILGDKYKVTRERIRQVLSKGLKKIKRWYKKDHPEI